MNISFTYKFKRGDIATARDEIKCDDDWEWTSEWLVDLNRAVDENGMSLKKTLQLQKLPLYLKTISD
jgi:hypothetical protein